MSQLILIVDDDRNVRTMVRAYLEQEAFRVIEAADGQQALLIARERRPDLILLDMMMPVMNGREFFRSHSRESDIPVIFVTARVEDNDKIIGLELGADDYVTKPFNMRELVARVRTVLRRVNKPGGDAQVLRAADIELDRAAFEVRVGGAPIELTRSEFNLLAALMGAPGRVFSRLDLLDAMSGDAFEGYERTIDVHIKNLRNKIEDDSKHPRYIETVYGVGYRFVKSQINGGDPAAARGGRSA
jgi:DNA-binding response OmpR family regulator